MLGSVPAESFLSIHLIPTFVLPDLKVLSTLRCVDNLALNVECNTGLMDVTEPPPPNVPVPLVALQGAAEPPELWCWRKLGGISCCRRQSVVGFSSAKRRNFAAKRGCVRRDSCLAVAELINELLFAFVEV